MLSSRRLSLGFFAFLALPVAVACSAADADKASTSNLTKCVKNQTVRCVCGIDEGEQTCDEDETLSACDCSRSSDRKKDDDTTRPVGTPETPEPVTSTPDASVTPVSLCVSLAACCEELRKAGFTGSESQCKRVVVENSGTACGLAHQVYRTPDGETDFVCL